MAADNLPPFHLAIPVHDLADARAFYGELLGCPEGRSSESWVDFNFFGHQLVCHLRFVIEPHIRFRGQSGEQATMFLLDPSGNAIEFKAFQDIASQLFKK